MDGEKQILHIEVKKSTKPVFVKHKDGEKFYDQKCDVFSAGIIFYVLLVLELFISKTGK